ncbi:thioredoxin peroxidase dot5, partial [Tilletia horrida]
MVTTRSRTAGTTATSAASSTAAAASTKKTTSSSAATSKPASAPKKTTAAAAAAPTSSKALSVGDALPESTPELTVHSGKEGETTSLGALVDASAKGIVVFFYPAANTPG